MPERPSFLPPADFVRLAPEPGGFEAALRTGERRRRRQLTQAGVALTLALGLLTTLQVPGRSEGQRPVDKVDQVDDRDPSSVDDRTGDDQPVRALPQASQPGGTAPSTRHGSEAGGQPSTEPGVSVQPPRKAAPPQTDEGLQYKRPVTRSENETIATNPCVQEWCLKAGVTPNGGDSYEFTLEVCRSVHSGTGVLDWRTTQQADFEVVDDAGDYWHWSLGQTFAASDDDLTVAGGRCYVWTTPYHDAVDNSGVLLKKGEYTLRAWSTAQQLGYSRVATASFTVTAE